MSLLGIDIGTTGCKAAAFSLTGQRLHLAYREYPTLYPQPGWAELDAQHVWACTQEAIAEVAAATRHDPITALTVSSLGEAATPVTLDRNILGPSILCSDTRGQEHIDALRTQITPEDFYQINANILSPAYTLPKLLWIKQHQPALYRSAHRFLLWGGLVEFLLGAPPSISHSHASRTLLFDIRNEDWSPRLLNLTGVDRDKLPTCHPAGTVIGTVPNSIADPLSLPSGVKIVTGGHDQCCNALGAGIIRAGQAIDGIGTFECIAPVYEPLPDLRSMFHAGLNVEHHVIPGRYVSFIYNQAGILLRWFRDTFCASERNDPAIYRRLDAETPAGPTNLFILPYFQTTGAPAFISNASGVIVGLRPSTTRGQIYKALMESITYYFAEAIEQLRQIGIDTSEFIATGGGAISDTWLQIKADILNTPYTRLAHSDCSVLGAALLAGIGTNVLPPAGSSSFPTFNRPTARFTPRPDHHRLYQHRLAQYRDLYPTLRHYLAQLAAN